MTQWDPVSFKGGIDCHRRILHSCGFI